MRKAPVPAMLRRQVDRWAHAWLLAKFSRLLELRAQDPGPFNYPIAVLTGFGRFDLSYFRHTERWFTVYRGLTAAECFQEIEENEIFWPTT